MAASSNSEDSIVGINIAPLVDVVLVLLIIFMATAPLIQRKSVSVNVPKVAHNEAKATLSTDVLINEKREVFLAGNLIRVEDLQEQVTRMYQADPTLHIAIAADENLPYGFVADVLDRVRGSGIKKVALEVRGKAAKN